MFIKKLLLGVSVAATTLALGCAQPVGFTKSVANAVAPPSNNPEPGPSPAVNVPACEIDMPQYLGNGDIMSFEFFAGVTVSFGYNPGGIHTPGPNVGGSVDVTSSKMGMVMFLYQPFDFGHKTPIYNSGATADQTNTTLGASVGYSDWHVNGQVVLPQQLDGVVKKGLEISIKGLATGSNSDQWVAHALQATDNGKVIINAGRGAGIAMGDSFEVYNVKHYWSGAPCDPSSLYRGRDRLSANPVMILQVKDPSDVGPTTTFATIVMADPTQTLIPGAEVVQPQSVKKVLKKRVDLLDITAKNFPTSDGSGDIFDFHTTVNDEVVGEINNAAGGFWVGNH